MSDRPPCAFNQTFLPTDGGGSPRQVQYSEHTSLRPGIVSLRAHDFQIRLSNAGGQVRAAQAAGEQGMPLQEIERSQMNVVSSSGVNPDFVCLQPAPLDQQMVESIKQEPIECAIEHPPLKKIKQEVSKRRWTKPMPFGGNPNRERPRSKIGMRLFNVLIKMNEWWPAM